MMAPFKLPEGVPQKPKKLRERESAVEHHLCANVKARGGIAYKFTSPQRRSVPDRLVVEDAAGAVVELEVILEELGVHNVNLPELRGYVMRIAERMIHFVELKATGSKPTEQQAREHAKLRALGFVVRVIDSTAEVNSRYAK